MENSQFSQFGGGFVDTFAGNDYRIGEGNILPRYYADDEDVVVVGKDSNDKKVKREAVKVIFYGLRQIRMNQYNYKSGKKFPKCFSTNFKTPTGGEEKQAVDTCAECRLHEWRKDEANKWIAPECAVVLETIVFDTETSNYALMQWKKTSLKVWKHVERLVFINLANMKSFNPQLNPIQQFIFELRSTQTVTGGTSHAIFTVKIDRELTGEEKLKHAQAGQSAYKYLLLRQTSELLIAPGQDYQDNTLNAPPLPPSPPVMQPPVEETPPPAVTSGLKDAPQDIYNEPVEIAPPVEETEGNSNFKTLDQQIEEDKLQDKPPF